MCCVVGVTVGVVVVCCRAEGYACVVMRMGVSREGAILAQRQSMLVLK